ncbi:MAG: ABC transporter ATP-binding protein [Synechococcus sp.]
MTDAGMKGIGTEIAIRVDRLTKQFAQLRSIPQLLRNQPVQSQTVLQDVSFQVGKGEVFGVLGTNGAGKTTLTRILCTMVWPDRGSVQVAGANVVQRPLDVRKSVGYVTCADRSFEERISAIGNLRFFAALNDLNGRELEHRVAEVIEQVGLNDFAHQAVRSFSTGMKQKLAIARALLHNPQILFLDEPTSGLDPLAADRFRRFLQQLSKEHQRTIFLCTHMPDEIEQLCDRVLFLHRGRSLASGTLGAIRRTVRPYSEYEIVTLEPPPFQSGAAIASGVEVLQIQPLHGCAGWLMRISVKQAVINPQREEATIAAVLQQLVALQLDVAECRKQEMSLADLYAALTENIVSLEARS